VIDMEERRPSYIGIIALSLIYWGALAWWQKDALFGTDSDLQIKALDCSCHHSHTSLS